KTLSGTDLRQALDPFADQTFYFNAVISKLDDLDDRKLPDKVKGSPIGITTKSLGVSRRTGTIWQARMPGVMEFGTMISLFRDKLEDAGKTRSIKRTQARSERVGLNYLSEPLDARILSEVKSPFEISLELGDPGDSGQMDEAARDR